MSSQGHENNSFLLEAKTLVELIAALQKVEGSSYPKVRLGISSNVTVEQSKYFIQKHGYLNRLTCEVSLGDYDNHIGNSLNFSQKGMDAVIVHSLFDNIVPSFERACVNMSDTQINEVLQNFISTLRLSLKNLASTKSVLIDRLFPIYSKNEHVSKIIDQFNAALDLVIAENKNVSLLNSEKVLERIGQEHATDLRYYYRYKAPFTTAFWDRFAESIFTRTRNFGTYFYKVLVLDCDNTLWSGIIGEDLLKGIKLSPHEYPGNIFYQVQSQILNLQKNGILLCLCSKNNAQDVDEVLQKHEYQLIRDEHIIAKKVNWDSKAENIKSLSKDLNLGLDSFIFIDDSDFEIEAVKSQLPQVRTIKVPSNLHLYPTVIDTITDLFISGGVTAESTDKTQQYKQMLMSAQELKSAGSVEDYIKSLQLKVDIRRNFKEKAVRIAELTQKSNQFNLTTKRYSEAEILKFMDSDDADVLSINISDKFGDSGLTGIVILNKTNTQLHIDSFLMSCRILGRGIEKTIWSDIFSFYKKQGFKTITSEYSKTSKNEQVESFFDQIGFEVQSSSANFKSYFGQIDEVIGKSRQNNIEVIFYEH